MIFLSEILMQNPQFESFPELLEMIQQRSAGEIHLKIDIKPNYPDTPADWEDKIEGAFSGVHSVFDPAKIKTEDDFYDLLMERAFDADDSFTFKELLNRMSPIAKATSPLITFKFNPEGKPHNQAKQALAAAANGEIPTDLANMFISSISSMLNIQEKTDFELRLKAIEDASKQD